MAYAAGEALILTQVRATSSFDSTNAFRQKWGKLNSGASRHYAFLRYGGWSEHQHKGFGGHYETRYRTICEVWVRYKDDDTVNELESKAAEILTRFDQYRLAADTTKAIQDVNVSTAGDPTEQWKRGGNGPAWVKQDLVIEWVDESNVTLQE